MRILILIIVVLLISGCGGINTNVNCEQMTKVMEDSSQAETQFKDSCTYLCEQEGKEYKDHKCTAIGKELVCYCQ